MKTYTVMDKRGEVYTIEAEYYSVDNGFVSFYDTAPNTALIHTGPPPVPIGLFYKPLTVLQAANNS